MKKFFFTFVILIYCSVAVYSQTWTEVRQIWGGKTFHREITVLTMQQEERLLRQYEEDYSYANLTYIDVLEMGAMPRVVSGTRPNFTGYYFLLIKEETPAAGIFIIMAYGHPNTGRMEIRFSPYRDTRIGSSYYINLKNRYIGWVNGE